VDTSYFRSIGGLGYVYLNEKDKLSQKSDATYFVGYSRHSRGYRMWNPKNNKITESRNVRFVESVMYGDRHRESNGSSDM
jgi:hypothetical protein